MSDTTTPTAYIEELAQLGYRAEVDRMVNEQIPTWAMNRWEDLPIDAHDSYRVVAKAAAEKVLEDLRRDLGDLGPDNMVHRLDGYLYLWAEAREIELSKGGEG